MSPTNHDRMAAAATWLAEQGFADIGWASQQDGKGPRRSWKSDATDDPALVSRLLHGARNALVIPKGRALVIDYDDQRAAPELEAAGLPTTFRIDSPTPGHGHVYAWAPDGVEMTDIPGTFEWGEIRRSTSDDRTSSMVLGPFSRRQDGTYAPHDDVHVIATLPLSVVEYLQESNKRKGGRERAARGPEDEGWAIQHGRHQFLVDRARHLRGVGLTDERLADELLRLDAERCDPPIATLAKPRGVDEVRAIAEWAMSNIDDDPPGVRIVSADTPSPGEGETRHLTKQSLAARRFVERMGDRVRFDHGRRRWLIWQGHRWRPDDDSTVRRLWFDVLAGRYQEALQLDDDKRESTIAAVQTAGATDAAVEAGIRLAASMLPVAMAGDEFDPDPWLLGCDNGLVELRTGTLRDGRPEDLVTRSTGWDYDPAATCPRWDRFLAEVFADDMELVDWFRKLIGASLVGTSKELLAL